MIYRYLQLITYISTLNTAADVGNMLQIADICKRIADICKRIVGICN